MTERAAEAARELSAVLVAEAENLTSDELSTISAAMTAVRAAARELESALTARGWGGGVLYGWGESPFDDEEEDDDSDDEDLDDEDEDDLEAETPWIVPSGTRMSYQARYDFVIVDEEAFLAYVERRAAEAGTSYTRGDIVELSPAFILGELQGFAGMDLEGSGLVFAGGQDTVRQVEVTLWEMDDAARDDQFPTSV